MLCHTASIKVLAQLLPQWRQLRWGAEKLQCQLEAEQTTRLAVQDDLQTLRVIADHEQTLRQEAEQEIQRLKEEAKKTVFQLQQSVPSVKLTTPKHSTAASPAPTPDVTTLKPIVLMEDSDNETPDRLPRAPSRKHARKSLPTAPIQCPVCLKPADKMLKFRARPARPSGIA